MLSEKEIEDFVKRFRDDKRRRLRMEKVFKQLQEASESLKKKPEAKSDSL